VFWFPLQLLSETFLILYIGLHVKTRYSNPILIELEFSRQFFEKYWNIWFHENPTSVRRDVPCGRTDMKLIVACRNFVNVPKNQSDLGNENCFQIIILTIAILRANTTWTIGPRFPIAALNLNTLTHVAMVNLQLIFRTLDEHTLLQYLGNKCSKVREGERDKLQYLFVSTPDPLRYIHKVWWVPKA
jgi:hypothetical protein